MLTPCSRVFLKEGKKRIWKEKKENVFSSFLKEERIWRDNSSLFSLKSYPPKSGMIWNDNFLLSFFFLPFPFLSFPSFIKLENRVLESGLCVFVSRKETSHSFVFMFSLRFVINMANEYTRNCGFIDCTSCIKNRNFLDLLNAIIKNSGLSRTQNQNETMTL